MRLFDALSPVRLLQHVPNVAEVVSSMGRSPMNDDSIQLELLFLPFVDQMSQFFLQIKLKVRVDLDSVERFVIKSKPVQCKHKNVWECFESCSQPHVLLGLADVAENLVVSLHYFRSQWSQQWFVQGLHVAHLDHKVIEILVPFRSHRTGLAGLVSSNRSSALHRNYLNKLLVESSKLVPNRALSIVSKMIFMASVISCCSTCSLPSQPNALFR